MIIAISRFAVKNGKEAEVRAAFEGRRRQVEGVPGFLGLEVFQRDAVFHLLTRWASEASFRAWHDASHHASHALIPHGIKLDPSQTQIVVAERIDGASAASHDGDLVSDLLLPIARMIREGTSIHIAIVDGEGRIARANPAFAGAIGRDPTGLELDALLTAGSRQALRANVASERAEPVVLQFLPPGGAPLSLRAFARRLPAGLAIVAEPPWDDHRALEAQLLALNAELAVLSRESTRQARLLEKTNRELHEAHWHLEKISEVLPICMSCHRVRTGKDTWEDAAAFLARHSDFLSHGYCPRCAAKLAAESGGAP